jgi:hypothetical protein
MRVLICGSRTWTDRAKIRDLIEELPYHAVVIHGAHHSGADKIADEEARAAGLRIERYPADWEKHGKSAGPRRNMLMVQDGAPDFAFAFHSKGSSRGTEDCVKRCREAGVNTYVIREDTDAETRQWISRAFAWEQMQMGED